MTEEDNARRDKSEMMWNRQWAVDKAIDLLKLHAENNRDINLVGINEEVAIKIADVFLDYVLK